MISHVCCLKRYGFLVPVPKSPRHLQLVAPGTAAWPTRVPAHGTIACGTSMPCFGVFGWLGSVAGAPKNYVCWFISPIKYRYIDHKP